VPRHHQRTAAGPRGWAAALLIPVLLGAGCSAPQAEPAEPVGEAAAAQEAPPAPTPVADTGDIVDLPVVFTVRNQNRTDVPCEPDGKEYRVRGHLTAPASVLEEDDPSVTLYLHGIATGEWYWRLDLPGYHYTRQMAGLGHASVTVDRLGYESSDKPEGLRSCIGAQADIAGQIVDQLRTGEYELEGEKPVEFDRVTLAGHSNGGQIAQIAAYTFPGIDGLMVMSWTDLGLTDQALQRFLTAFQECVDGGEPAEEADDPRGYVHYDPTEQEFVTGNFHDAEQEVIEATLPLRNRHPCGDMASQLAGVVVDRAQVAEIDIPVLLLYGADDARVQGQAEHEEWFSGSPDTELVVIPSSGHFVGLERRASEVTDSVSAWLERQEGQG